MHFTRKSMIVLFAAVFLIAPSVVHAEAPATPELLSAADLLLFYENQAAISSAAAPVGL